MRINPPKIPLLFPPQQTNSDTSADRPLNQMHHFCFDGLFCLQIYLHYSGTRVQITDSLDFLEVIASFQLVCISNLFSAPQNNSFTLDYKQTTTKKNFSGLLGFYSHCFFAIMQSISQLQQTSYASERQAA